MEEELLYALLSLLFSANGTIQIPHSLCLLVTSVCGWADASQTKDKISEMLLWFPDFHFNTTASAIFRLENA